MSTKAAINLCICSIVHHFVISLALLLIQVNKHFV